MRGGGELDQRAWCLNSLPHIASKLKKKVYRYEYLYTFLLLSNPKENRLMDILMCIEMKNISFQHHAPVFNALQFLYDIYASTIKSPSAVQISKSIKQTQSVDKI